MVVVVRSGFSFSKKTPESSSSVEKEEAAAAKLFFSIPSERRGNGRLRYFCTFQQLECDIETISYALVAREGSMSERKAWVGARVFFQRKTAIG